MNTLSVDHRDPLFPRGPGLGLRAFALLAICGSLIYFDFQTPKLAPLRSTLALALSPVLWVASLPQHFSDASGYLDSRDKLAEENKQLRDRQFQLEAKLQKFQALEAENHRIRELLASAKNLQENVLITEIIAANQDPYRHQITLNKGARDQVYRGQALVDATGVMGQIIQVNPTTSVALLITDPDHGIPVEINRTGLQTIALGRGDGHGLSLPYLPGNADVKVCDLLVSSGLGGRFPAGYPVGEIHELRHAGGESFMEAIAYPKAHLNQGRQALLVWSERALPSSAPGEETVHVPIDLPAKPPAKAPKQAVVP